MHEFLLIKREPDGRTYEVYIRDGKELSEHIGACYKYTDHIVLGVVRIKGD